MLDGGKLKAWPEGLGPLVTQERGQGRCSREAGSGAEVRGQLLSLPGAGALAALLTQTVHVSLLPSFSAVKPPKGPGF